ncbi:Prismane-like [Moorella glycerini]|uniref:Carbon monoxide dehydrogenase 2 n=1 Tax=Neomoorella stamsii TaxID=1266720 RepID=A0A9X7J3Q5_9FIRM|nr:MULTISPECIES: hypothetical protein [Moorella]PRR74338.1 Carbon monoxide dehydrogenase 2 [Moorella stamsii]CEP66745.1 Prismane-like [Moorella glycerini]
MFNSKNILAETPRRQPEGLRCGFAKLGLCCTRCPQGPCRIDPFGYGASLGACGAGADNLAGRSTLEKVLAGSALYLEESWQLETAVTATIPAGKLSLWKDRGVWPGPAGAEMVSALARVARPGSSRREELELKAIRVALAAFYAGLDQQERLYNESFGLTSLTTVPAGPGLLSPEVVSIVIDGSRPHLAAAIKKQIAAMATPIDNYGARGIQLIAAGREGDYLAWRLGLPYLGNEAVLRETMAAGLVDLVAIADTSGILLPFQLTGSRIKGVNLNEIKPDGSNWEGLARELIRQALAAHQEGQVISSNLALKPHLLLTGWSQDRVEMVAAEALAKKMRGIALLFLCEGTRAVDLARQLLEEGFLVLAGGCGLDELIAAGYMGQVLHLGGCRGLVRGLAVAAAVEGKLPLKVYWPVIGCSRAYPGIATVIAHGAEVFLARQMADFISPGTARLFGAICHPGSTAEEVAAGWTT